ncbi:hypothetical protein NHQ30_001669, partial [Ciborinia camelliae]
MRPNDGEGLDTIMEEPEENAGSDGVEYDYRSKSNLEGEFEFPSKDDSEAEEDEDEEEENGGDDISMSDADRFILPLR